MRVKKILLFALLFTAVFCELISLIKPKPPTPPPSEDSTVPTGPPCGENQASCGEAAKFQSQGKLVQFMYQFKNEKQHGSTRGSDPGTKLTGQTGAAMGTFSGTTVQVQNVDEADLLKTDGEYIYTISNNVLSIIRAYPPEKAQVLYSQILGYDASAMFIEGNYLAVFGTEIRGEYITYVDIFDVSNKQIPKHLKKYGMTGRYFDGRKLQDGYVYLISTHKLSSTIPWFDFWLAQSQSYFWYPQTPYIDPLAVNILSFNLRDPINFEPNGISIMSESNNVIYMSEQYIYLATNYTDEDGEISTKVRKIYVWGDYIQPFADGVVKGTVKDQFSLDQYGRFLRIATTRKTLASITFVGVYTLDYRLEPYGGIPNAASFQVVASCRFVNQRLYLSTSNQIDPFIIVGFPTHKNPKVLGRLKISGYSTYIHPYDETTIIGLGRDVRYGQKLGLKIVLLDVTDPARPRQIINVQISERYANSIAEWEHKAFLFSAEKNLLVIPARMNFADNKFNGALAFTITKNSISLGSMIDHLGPNDDFNERSVERSLWIRSFLFTKSLCLLKINQLNYNYDEVGSLNIPCRK